MARTQAADYDKKREIITKTATELFGRQGFMAATISEIAAHCNVSKSLIYHYYPSKEEILFDVMNDHIDNLLTVVANHNEQNHSTKTKLKNLTKDLLKNYAGSADAQKVLLYEMDSLPAKKKENIVKKQRKLISFVREIIQEESAIVDQDNARLSARTMLYFGMLNWTHNWFRPSGGLSRDELADLAAETILASS